MTQVDEGLIRLYRALESIGAPLMVGGGVASIFFGEPRTTVDIDVIIDAGDHDADRIVAALDPDQFHVPPLDTNMKELARGSRGHFNLIDFQSGMKADVYPAGDDALARYGFEHALDGELAGAMMRFAPATYVVAMKLRYCSMSKQDRHLRDIRGMLGLSRNLLDESVIARWAAACGTSDAWARCKESIGEE